MINTWQKYDVGTGINCINETFYSIKASKFEPLSSINVLVKGKINNLNEIPGGWWSVKFIFP